MAPSIDSGSDPRGAVSLRMEEEEEEEGGVDADRRRLLPGGGEGSGDLRSKDHKVSFKEGSPSEDFRRRHRDSPGQDFHRLSRSPGGRGRGGDGEGEVLLCSGNASFRRRPSFVRISRTASRLTDSPLRVDRRSGRSAVSASAWSHVEDDDEDVPEGFKKMEFSSLTLLQLVSLVLIFAALVCSLSVPAFKRQTFCDLKLWKWEIMLLVIICGHLCSGWGIRVAVFFIERNFLLRKRVLYFVYGLRKSVQNCIWLGLVLIAWTCLLDDTVEREIKSRILPYVTKIFVSLLMGTSLWLLKTLIVKVLALNFHVNMFFDRIQESLFNQYVIETLSMPPLIERECFHEEEERGVIDEVCKHRNAGCFMPGELRASPHLTRSGRVIASGGLERSPKVGKSPRLPIGSPKEKEEDEITIDHLHKLTPYNVSAWNMKRLMNIVRHGTLYTLDERILNSNCADESSLEIRNELQAKRAAKKIFHNVAKMGSRYIYLEDLVCFMSEDEALKTMHLFEGVAEGNKISKTALKNWMVNTFRERRSLALSLNDTNTAVDELQHFLSILVAIIIAIISLLILKIRIRHFLVVISSQVLLLKFVFGNTAKMIFEAIIFLFVMHPFDVGDRCEVEGVQMVVEEMKILTTVFLRYDNQKIIYPNSVLATKAISNYYRSPDMGDGIEFRIHISTPTDKIAIMKERIKQCIISNNDHWYPDPMIFAKDVEELNSLNIALWLTHRMNYQNIGERWDRRALLVEQMVKIFKELDIEYRFLPLDVNIRSMPNSNTKRDFF